MKKLLLSMGALLCITFSSFSQTTYYWVGGSGSQNTTGSTAIPWVAANWNTAQVGSGSQRTVSAGNDILIFDGNAPGLAAKSVYIRDLPRDSTGQLKLVNGAKVFVLTLAPVATATGTVAFGAAYGGVTKPVTGTGTDFSTTLRKGDYIFNADYTTMSEVLSVSSDADLTIASDASVAPAGTTYSRATALYIKGNPGLTIDAGCSLNFGISVGSSSQLGAFVLAIQPGATGIVNGDFSFLSRAMERGLLLMIRDRLFSLRVAIAS
ncbi:MAG: hypothetical protein ABIX01_12435 [Chitinophagaceae bacterium]